MNIFKILKTGIESLLTASILIIAIFILAIVSGGEYTWYIIIPMILLSMQTLYWLVYALISLIKKWK